MNSEMRRDTLQGRWVIVAPGRSWRPRDRVAWAPEALGNVKKNIDYAEYGGALLLGVAGAVVVGHGRSDEVAVANALVLAARQLDTGVNEAIVRGIAEASASA